MEKVISTVVFYIIKKLEVAFHGCLAQAIFNRATFICKIKNFISFPTPPANSVNVLYLSGTFRIIGFALTVRNGKVQEKFLSRDSVTDVTELKGDDRSPHMFEIVLKNSRIQFICQSATDMHKWVSLITLAITSTVCYFVDML